MDKTTNPSMAASFCGLAPISGLEGTAVPFAGYPIGMSQLTGHSAPTLAAVRKDDARVPEPRGRQR